MAGKVSVFTTQKLFHTLNSISKNAWIDLVVDRARAEIGAGASDEDVATLIQGWLGPVIRERGDRPVSLIEIMGQYDTGEKWRRDAWIVKVMYTVEQVEPAFDWKHVSDRMWDEAWQERRPFDAFAHELLNGD